MTAMQELSGGEAVGGVGPSEAPPQQAQPSEVPPFQPSVEDPPWAPQREAPPTGHQPPTRDEIFEIVRGATERYLDELARQAPPPPPAQPPPAQPPPAQPHAPYAGYQPEHQPQAAGPPPMPEWDPLDPENYLAAFLGNALQPIFGRLAEALDSRFDRLNQAMERLAPLIDQYEQQRVDDTLNNAFHALSNEIGWFPPDLAKKEAVWLMSRGVEPMEALRHAAATARATAGEIGQQAIEYYKQQIGQATDALSGAATPAPGAGAAQAPLVDEGPVRGRERYRRRLEQSLAALQGAAHIRIPTG